MTESSRSKIKNMPFILLTYVEYSFDTLFMRWQLSKVIHQTIFFWRWSMGGKGLRTTDLNAIVHLCLSDVVLNSFAFLPKCLVHRGNNPWFSHKLTKFNRETGSPIVNFCWHELNFANPAAVLYIENYYYSMTQWQFTICANTVFWMQWRVSDTIF